MEKDRAGIAVVGLGLGRTSNIMILKKKQNRTSTYTKGG